MPPDAGSEGARPSEAKVVRKSVLVVEDNPVNMRLFAAMLETCGDYDLLMAKNGIQGVELAHQHAPDLIIMDVQLPQFSGIDAIRALKSDERTRRIPIVVATALPAEEVIESGCDSYLLKPITIAQFQEMLRSFLPDG